MKRLTILLLVLVQTALATRLLGAKEYQYAVGAPPDGLTPDATMKWLAGRGKPPISTAPAKIAKAVRESFKPDPAPVVEWAVLGPPRVTGIAAPKLYAWIIAKSGGKILHEGVAKFALDGETEAAEVRLIMYFSKSEYEKDRKRVESHFPADVMLGLRLLTR